jgi:hypothetical protein
VNQLEALLAGDESELGSRDALDLGAMRGFTVARVIRSR